MAWTWTKKHVTTMADTLDLEYDTVEDAAKAALETATQLVEDRAKWAVVGQVVSTREHGTIPPDHEQAVKVVLGMYDTDTKANDAAAQLTSSTASGDSLRVWVLPVFHGSANQWHTQRREQYAAMETAADVKREQKLKASIAKHQQAQQDRANEIRRMEQEADQQWPCPGSIVKADKCRHQPSCK